MARSPETIRVLLQPCGDPDCREDPGLISEPRPRRTREAPAIARIVAIDRLDRPFVVRQNGPAVPARSTVALSRTDIGREVLLLFEDNNPCKPIIVGMLTALEAPSDDRAVRHVTIDGNCVTIAAESEVVLKCGEASITLTRAGKVIIRGKAVLSRASGVNRIKGASVQIN